MIFSGDKLSADGRAAPGGPAAWSLRSAPVFLVLAAVVLIPSACVLWFMNAAMRNERLAVRQKLSDIYLGRMEEAASQFDGELKVRFDAASAFRSQAPSKAFAGIILADLADAAVCYDDRGASRYPQTGESTLPGGDAADVSTIWLEADQPARAAAIYGDRAASSTDPREAALALRDQARCLLLADDAPAALEALEQLLASDDCDGCRDRFGRLIRPDALLLAGRLAEGAAAAAWYESLAELLGDYATDMPASQRRFLLGELLALPDYGGRRDLRKLLAGETLAARYLAGAQSAPQANLLSDERATGLLHVSLAEGSLVLIYEHLPVDIEAMRRRIVHEQGIACEIQPASANDDFVRCPLSSRVRDYVISLKLDGDNPLTVAAERQRAAYLWTGGLGIAAIAVLAALVARTIARQMKLTRLKNDLIATVSHELKTPLASMRLLIDTLEEGRTTGPEQERDYFRMIRRENERLTRLIDNFLTFSRMERNRRVMRFAPANLAGIVDAAVASVGDRFDGRRARIEVDLPDALPGIRADRDSLITVLVNLLDNAWKYSGEDKLVRITARAEAGFVVVEVADNGIGMTRGQLRKVFDRFYQADNSLSRASGGCGLGLSIVKFIVDAHGGTIEASSRPGRGSVFTLALPIGRPSDGEEDGHGR